VAFDAGGTDGYFLARAEFGRTVRASLNWAI